LPDAHGWGERLLRRRTSLGLSQKAAAKRLGVDPSTLARWERGEREPAGALLSKVQSFCDGFEAKSSPARRVS
jgi:transcriptional regulator with XRE-family HTH domain